MSADEGKEEYEEVQADIRRKDEEVCIHFLAEYFFLGKCLIKVSIYFVFQWLWHDVCSIVKNDKNLFHLIF